MRTTLTLAADAFQAAKSKGKAVSDLILQGLRGNSTKATPSAVFRSEGGTYTSKEVEEALDDE